MAVLLWLWEGGNSHCGIAILLWFDVCCNFYCGYICIGILTLIPEVFQFHSGYTCVAILTTHKDVKFYCGYKVVVILFWFFGML